MISGPREARPTVLRRLLATVAARDLAAFVVPGPDVARAYGIDLDAAGLRVVDTPRHACVLVLVGEPSAGLKSAAAVAFAQMPRPRAVLGVGDVSPPPVPDVSVAASQGELAAGASELRRHFAGAAFAAEVALFEVDELRTKTAYVCPMHPEVTSADPGSCPRCGMDLVPRESALGAGRQGHGHSGDADHGDHGMGFMSMVEITRGTPRSSDGLQMEWAEVPFGPLFPGLPGGLSLKFTLDGDTVAGVETRRGVDGWGPDGLDGAPAGDIPCRLALLDPLSPTAYRILALRALEDAAGAGVDERVEIWRVGALELERAASHLGWFSGLGHLLGHPWLEARAGGLQLALLRADGAHEVARLEPEIGAFLRRVSRAPLLARRLKGVGTLPGPADASGPVARAGGIEQDARGAEEVYRSLGFEPVVREGDDAHARLRRRLAEVEHSLRLVRRAGSVSLAEAASIGGATGTGDATVETPRGTARLRLTLENGAANDFVLRTPSTENLRLVEAVVVGRELADALVGVASLDLSPWEVAR